MNLINWKELSRKLAGNNTSITRNRIPKKYQNKVNSLISTLKDWEEKNIKTDYSNQVLDKEAQS